MEGDQNKSELTEKNIGAFVENAMRESIPMSTTFNLYLNGPHFYHVMAPVLQAANSISLLDETITSEMAELLATGNQHLIPTNQIQTIQLLQQMYATDIEEYLQTKDKLLIQHGQELASQGQTLQHNVLSYIQFRPQITNESSNSACFRQIFHRLTLLDIPPETLLQLFTNHPELHLENLFQIFETKLFKEAFPELNVKIYSVVGFDLNNLQKIRQVNPNKFIAFFPQLRAGEATTNEEKEYVTLLSSNDQYVHIHDSSDEVGGMFKGIPYQLFFDRWAKGQLKGKLVLADVEKNEII